MTTPLIKNRLALAVSTAFLIATLSACDGDDGRTGDAGIDGVDGTNGEDGVDGASALSGLSTTLVARTVLNAESPEGAAEIVQYQQSTGYLFAINSSGDNGTVEILDLSSADPSALTVDAEGVVNNTNLDILNSINLSDNTSGDANSIAISDELGLLAVAMAADDVATNGQIALYDIAGAAPVFIKNIEVGVLPDMVTFSPDSSKIIVANEGEPSGDYAIDPEGTVSIINITGNEVADTAIAIRFTPYNDMQAELEAQGAVFPNPSGRTINGVDINITVAMDLEPEYVAVSADSTTAYISMQENNAMAVVDLTTDTLVDVRGLGFKGWSQYLIDASDRDGGINLQRYDNLFGIYQPDTIATIRWQGADFIVTANEGDAREYFFDVVDENACIAANGLDFDDDDGCLSYTDEIRAEDLTLEVAAFANVNNDDDDLGRLQVTTELGDGNGDDTYEELYTFGGRSFSIFDANGTLVFDSGDDIVRITSAVHGGAFNNDEDENEGDTRSDAKGAEPEALAIGEIDGRTIAFIGLERMSGILAYDVTNPFNVSFLHYFYNRGLVEGADITGDLGPEGMAFIPATDSSSARLIVGNEISGSVSVWEVRAQ
ncbi:choice-of-anchor I family protein [Alteromonas sp. 5E99-2]|uniref:choice-of-anchor I family protein n=1 Tax=Alteromonas sp. 5E99-2 TaxID=2817683 RepID=UPI001A992141|nr:choice-of-anchor I family protein [Alteromonas sp. 5E99-2]MBO1254752.1 choice-of-anchor I family protein [Alteromonas sp. 5E99-2]